MVYTKAREERYGKARDMFKDMAWKSKDKSVNETEFIKKFAAKNKISIVLSKQAFNDLSQSGSIWNTYPKIWKML